MTGFRSILALVLALWPGGALALELSGQFIEGGLAFGRAEPGTRIFLGTRSIRVAPDGAFVIGFGRGEPDQVELTVIGADDRVEHRWLAIESRAYDVQRIDQLDQAKVTPSEVDQARIAADQELINQARAPNTDARDLYQPFIWPAHGPISGVYGSQRILNGEPRQPHYGVDVAAPEGDPVIAPAGGIVRLAEPDLFLTGGTIILDHGFGINSTFLHMRKLLVKVGDRLEQGDAIGEIGQTGRATGPHLHWGLNWGEVRLDPALLVPPMEYLVPPVE